MFIIREAISIFSHFRSTQHSTFGREIKDKSLKLTWFVLGILIQTPHLWFSLSFFHALLKNQLLFHHNHIFFQLFFFSVLCFLFLPCHLLSVLISWFICVFLFFSPSPFYSEFFISFSWPFSHSFSHFFSQQHLTTYSHRIILVNSFTSHQRMLSIDFGCLLCCCWHFLMYSLFF